MIDKSAVDALLIATRQAPTVRLSDTGLVPYVLVPDGYDVKSLEELRTTLDRVKQRVSLLTSEAFIAYWNRFADANSVIFADERKGTYAAIIDYHRPQVAAAWCQHVAVFTAEPSLEWKVWTGANGKQMDQPTFARFIEDNYVDIVKPPHADMLAVASNLTAKRSVDFAEAVSLQTGETQLQYQEKIRGSADTKSGSIKIPDKFHLAIPPLLGSERVTLVAMFRYGIQDMRLQLKYDLHRPTQVWDAAIQATTTRIRTQLKDAPFFLGSAG